MTALLAAPKTRSTALGPARPQVNLLPPEVRAARGLRKVKHWLGISLVVTVVVCIGVFGFGLVSVSQANTELGVAQNETARLNRETTKYAEVPKVLDALGKVRTARALGMSTEVSWKPLLEAMGAVLPRGVSIDKLSVSGATPMIGAEPPSDPLQAASVGKIAFTARSATLPDSAAWMDALDSVPGLSDSFVSAATVASEGASTYYVVQATVQFTDQAYADRFAATDGTK